MPITERDPPGLVSQVAEAVNAYHPELQEYRLRFTVLMARAQEPRPKKPRKGQPPPEPKPPAPPVKDRGVPALATVQFASYEQRLAGRTNFTLKVDADAWDRLLPEERAAALDHYLGLVEIVSDDEGNPVTEEDGCPKLRRRRYDHSIGIFADTVSRHGRFALEVQALNRAVKDVAAWGRDARPQANGTPEPAMA